MAKQRKAKRVNGLRRIFCLGLALCVLFFCDFGRVAYLILYRGDELSAKAETQQLSDTEISATRGTIYDSEGNILAQSTSAWNIYLDPSNIDSDDERNNIVDGLSEIFDYDDDEKAELLEKAQKDTQYVVVEEKVDSSIKDEITEFSKSNGYGNIIGTEETTKRYYPYDSLASTVLGFTSTDGQGVTGLEKYYDEELTGTDGRLITVKDANSNTLTTDSDTSIDAVNGSSLVLTINQTIQYTLESEMRSVLEEYQCKGVYGIVMDCNTGAILAMSSLPDFDCNDPYTITYSKTEQEIEDEETDLSTARQEQWRNFTVSDTYVPGSVFKTFTASAALEEGVVTLDTTYTCGGSIEVDEYTMKCHNHSGHGTQTLTQGLENSCNPFFITIGQRLGVHKYFKYFEAFGFTEKTGIDLPGESTSIYYKEEQYSIVELSSAAFGQTNSLTPIQVCTALSAIANGGTLLQPYVVSEILDDDGNTISKTQKTEVRNVISEETAQTVLEMMQSVVENGTGKNAYVSGYSVAGKTGTSTKLGETSENEDDKYIVSFAAIAPVDDPQIAMIILADEPNEDLGGGAICGPIAASVVESAMDALGIEPTYSDDTDDTVTTPGLVGSTVSDAKSTLTNSNLKYKIVGDGDTIVSQNPGASTSISKNSVVVLYTESGDKTKVTIPDFTGLTISEAKSIASQYNLNIKLSGNTSSGTVAYKQSLTAGDEVEIGTVITVSFKSTTSVLD